MISVVIPLYNKAAYIYKSVDSVLQQTDSDFELIIVNDGSTDNSLEIVQQVKDNRIRIIDQPNTGVSTARNIGVKAAKYNYIALLDADDWWDSHYLEEMQQLIHKYPDAGLWAAKYYKVKNGRNIEANIGLKKDFDEGYIDYINVYTKTMWMPITSSSFITQKIVFEELNGYKAKLKIGEDFDLWIRIALKHNIAYLNKPLVYYNQDIEPENRAVSTNKFYDPECNFIFRLDYLKNEEAKNPDLKQLLDNLRVYGLMKYHIFKKHEQETKNIIKQVDFNNQPLSVKFKYKFPILLIRRYYDLRKFASKIKTQIKSHKRSIL